MSYRGSRAQGPFPGALVLVFGVLAVRLSLWHRVQLWIARHLAAGVPRPQPILLRELYPGPLRQLHARLQMWEEMLERELQEGAPWPRVDSVLRAARLHLLQLQRMYYLETYEAWRWEREGIAQLEAVTQLLEAELLSVEGWPSEEALASVQDELCAAMGRWDGVLKASEGAQKT